LTTPYTTLHIRDFVKTDIRGVVDLDLSRTVLRELAGLARNRHVPRILVDLRESVAGMTIADAIDLVADLPGLGVSPDTRIAVVMPDDGERLKRGLYVQALASGKGYEIRPFLDFAAAAEWLSEDV
jgi:hypothetical protein